MFRDSLNSPGKCAMGVSHSVTSSGCKYDFALSLIWPLQTVEGIFDLTNVKLVYQRTHRLTVKAG